MDAFDFGWKFVWEKLFCRKTNLFYDYLADGIDSTSCLPTPEEIAIQFPNPCSWGTGMEDSMMSAGNMLETAIVRFLKEKNPVFAENAHTIFKGMKLCATVSSSPGFLARSVSPVDGHSHFMNSSRDQYTHFVYAAWKFYHSDIASEEEKTDIRNILAAFADRGIRNVNAEHQFDYLREDGKPGLVTRMWRPHEVWTHEVMRFPMFCLAAWDVTGDEKYRSVYRNLIGEAITRNQEQDLTISWAAFALLQMQYSLRLIYDLEQDTSTRSSLLKLMQDTARYSQKYVLEVREKLHRGELKTDAVNPNWRTRSFILETGNMINGYAYFNPQHEKIYSECCFEPLRAAAQGIIIQQLCPNWQILEEQYDALKEIAESIDYGKITCYAPILFSCAWFSR